MPEARGGLARRAALEAMAWYAAAALFLAAYVGIMGGRPAAVLPHLRLVTEAFLALAAARIALSAVLPPHGARIASTALALTGFGALLFYYVLISVSLRSWGRVMTWEHIASYAPQVPLLLEAMGVSSWIAVLAALSAAMLLAVFVWLHARRLDWVGLVAQRTARAPRGIVATVFLAIIVVDLHQYLILPPIDEREPVSLTFFSARRAIRMQNHGVDRAAAERRNVDEDAARDAYQPSPAAQRRNVVLIVSDALRADHMDVYGYGRETTPNLSRLRGAGVLQVAPAVRSVCSETFCGLLGLMGSRYLHQFPERMFTLAEALKRHGYRTAMIMGGDHTNFYGLRERYGSIDHFFDGSTAGEHYLNDDQLLLDHVKGLADWDGRPVFMQFHLMSTHMLGKRHEATSRYQPAANYFFVTNRGTGDDGKTYEKAVNFYDNGVRGMDAAVAALLETLRGKGYLANAVVAITGDHGESLGEHGLWGHQNGLNEEVVRVPFLLLAYGYQPQARLDLNAWPSQVDVAPTILAELGMPRPKTWSGLPLQGSVRRDFIRFEEGPMLGLIDTRDGRSAWKYVEDRSDGKAFAYNLVRDPRESRNALAEVPGDLLRDWQRALVPVKAQYVADPWK
ncbi:MAG TPA: sulfatase-like hydrolase/transferase [Usitatibacter sp.]|nr:sulfatase-like hydrolase/transferase [Usitatibacter sp.]